MLRVFKQADGRDRWVIVSSSAFRDRDGEIVSTKALEDDVARADVSGDYGPLRWWHIKGLDIGDCDYNAMHGRLLVESGTFRNPAFARMAEQHADHLGVSIGFLHPDTEPDHDGVFHTIVRKERSLLPRGKESNLLTFVSVVSKETAMTNEKVDTLKTLTGDAGAVESILAGAAQVDKAAESAGIAFKESAQPAPVAPAVKGFEPAEDDDEDEDTEPTEKPKARRAKKAAATIGAMSVDEFAQRMGEAFKASLAGMIESQKATQDALKSFADKFTDKLDEVDERVKELEGEQPAATRAGHAVSQDNGDMVGALKEILGLNQKSANQMDGLVDFMMGKK